MEEMTQEAFEKLDIEFQFLVDKCGVDGDLLGWHWAVHMLGILYPQLLEKDCEKLVQEIGWH